MALIDKYSEQELRKIVNNSYSMKEVIDKLGYSTHSGNNHITVKKRLVKYNIDTSHFKSTSPVKRTNENVFINNSTASQHTLRQWYLKNNFSEYKCLICGLLPIWNDKELTLILDHINGEKRDDRLENLRWVCPNCNQQLDTTKKRISNKIRKKINVDKKYCKQCGIEISNNTKNNVCHKCFCVLKRKCTRPTRNELKELIRNSTFRLIASRFGVSDKAVTEWCLQYKLPDKKYLIKNYTDQQWELV